jgi:hypothetical protein
MKIFGNHAEVQCNKFRFNPMSALGSIFSEEDTHNNCKEMYLNK